MSKLNNWELVQDSSWENYEEIPALIMASYLTLFEEMENSIHTDTKPKIDVVFLQAGVGSFAAAGISYYLNKYGELAPKIVIVEPHEADCVFYSLKKGAISTSLGNGETIMEGLNCGTPSLIAWDLLKNGVDISLKISDSFSKQAVRELYFVTGSDQKIKSKESGAAGLAGFIAIMTLKKFNSVKTALELNENSDILFINTEGPTDTL